MIDIQRQERKQYTKCSKEEEGKKKNGTEQQIENRNTVDIHSTVSVIILNVNGLNLCQRQSLSGREKKKNPGRCNYRLSTRNSL